MGQANLLLKQARLNVGLTQDEIANELGIGIKTYSGWECGDHKPYPRHRRALAPIFKMSIEQVNALFGDVPSGNGGTPAGTIELKDASEYREEQNEYLQSDLALCLLSIVNAGNYDDLRKEFAQIIEQFDAMNTENQEYEITRRQALIGLATFPFVPPISLEKRERVASSHYELFLKECGASLSACEELADSSDAGDIWLAFRCVCRYLVELELISNTSLRYRTQALELAARCAILKANLGWDCKGNSSALIFAQDAIRISRDSGNICLQLSAQAKLAWAYLFDDERELALETAGESRNLLEKYKEQQFPICIRGGIWSTLSVMQARNGLDPDRAIKKASEQWPDNEVQFLMEFTGENMWKEQGDALYYFGETGDAMNAYTRVIDAETLDTIKPFQGTLTENLRLRVIEGMARASLEGEARNMGNAIRYWEEAIEGAKRMKSESKYRRVLAIYDAMKIAFPGEKQIHNLRDRFRSGKGWK
jgi:transcriptional regulator with XRE-family HTH domain